MLGTAVLRGSAGLLHCLQQHLLLLFLCTRRQAAAVLAFSGLRACVCSLLSATRFILRSHWEGLACN